MKLDLSWEDREVLVVGAGESGLAAARLLTALKCIVTITDQKREDLLPGVRDKAPESVRWLFGPQNKKVYEDSDLIVISPGVPYDLPELNSARSCGVEVVGEMELAFREQSLPILAVTGSNGKTTVTSLTSYILAKSPEFNPFTGGNIGNPLSNLACDYVIGRRVDFNAAVLEVSSFQLETTSDFVAEGAAVLNVTPDHLDRHRSMADYFHLKCRIFDNQTTEDVAVLNEDDYLLSRKTVKGRRFGFSRRRRPPVGGYVRQEPREDVLVIVEGEKILAEAPWSEFKLFGTHNQENVLASVGLAMAVGMEAGEALLGARDFRPGDHRLQLVDEINGIRYYDDSKGTNVGAVAKALENFDDPIVLIAGGRDKDLDFAFLRPLIEEKVKNLVLIGETQDKMRAAFRGAAPVSLADSMEEAVSVASRLASAGQIVLLSPACASFDMFKDYKDRGEAFCREVKALKKGPLPRPGRQGGKKSGGRKNE
ncbi:MAG: UDP-N-acetylmuramoyl-L-alanine--D-glutamate ligase [Deltaproteobacteria bacterium]|jgi:UDP-N-acetylmuramoylalanine--D-glutamate ligase|nr:UDP-N-acetylmuramoyl-L-alanine--D-glutamate ligase [Deltaproteobacteria bacterium]